MNNENSIIEMLKLLKINNIYASTEFEKDLVKLVTTNIKKFIKTFVKDIRRIRLDQLEKFEPLKLNAEQRRKLDGNTLYRYEYRKDSNLRCIYILDKENNNNIILLNAFNEDGDKKRGPCSYNDNIERAIRIYLNSLGGTK